MSVIRLKNEHGEFLTTCENLDRTISQFLPGSVNDLRTEMQSIVTGQPPTPAANGYADIHTRSELLIMISASSWDKRAPHWEGKAP